MIFQNNLQADLFIPIFRNSPHTGGGIGPDKMIHSLSEKYVFKVRYQILNKIIIIYYLYNYKTA